MGQEEREVTSPLSLTENADDAKIQTQQQHTHAHTHTHTLNIQKMRRGKEFLTGRKESLT